MTMTSRTTGVTWFRAPSDDHPGILNACYNALDIHVVRGHADDPLNHRVDALAVAAMAPFRKRRGGTKPG